MSTLGGSSGSNSGNMGAPFFHEFKKQASFFLKEKIKTARLALTDVTPAQLLMEEATNGNPWTPDTRTLKIISGAAFEVDDYWRIVEILHKRLVRFDKRNWRVSYKSLIVLEHLLTHGPESVAEEFQSDTHVIAEMGSFQLVDEKGFNWGLHVGKKSERMLKLLEKGPLLKEERQRARKLTRGIEGFGSFVQRATPEQVQQESTSYRRFNSQFSEHGDQENQLLSPFEQSQFLSPQLNDNENVDTTSRMKLENAKFLDGLDTRLRFKENKVPVAIPNGKEKASDALDDELDDWNCSKAEAKPLLSGQEGEDSKIDNPISTEEVHPFNDGDHLTTVSLLSTRDHLLQAC